MELPASSGGMPNGTVSVALACPRRVERAQRTRQRGVVRVQQHVGRVRVDVEREQLVADDRPGRRTRKRPQEEVRQPPERRPRREFEVLDAPERERDRLGVPPQPALAALRCADVDDRCDAQPRVGRVRIVSEAARSPNVEGRRLDQVAVAVEVEEVRQDRGVVAGVDAGGARVERRAVVRRPEQVVLPIQIGEQRVAADVPDPAKFVSLARRSSARPQCPDAQVGRLAVFRSRRSCSRRRS